MTTRFFFLLWGKLTKAPKVVANLLVEDLLYLVDSLLVCKNKRSVG